MSLGHKPPREHGDGDDGATAPSRGLEKTEHTRADENQHRQYAESDAIVQLVGDALGDLDGDETCYNFHQLQVNTNLNQTPSNWLRGGSKLENYLKHVHASWGKPSSEFSSIRMANICPELVDELDVICNAENIKRLLKIQHSKRPVSMMVHRVGKTLLLDEFDVHDQLLRQQQEDWKWLKTFYEECVQENKKIIPRKCKIKTRDHLQSRNMFSKFLYHSLSGGDVLPQLPDEVQLRLEAGASKDVLPEVCPNEFQRTILWNFEDIRMLIGTDLPIFGGDTRPCISLRLRDSQDPINVLTGIDYWLDNLMCNVPELAMCYHLDGIVKKYEVLKTEEIPELDNARFSPGVIKDIAQNILSFLKTNATKEGHTYWLFKESDTDIVKLYDLTTLCADLMTDRLDNPFTVPVGMLLYRVARNMYQSTENKKVRTIQALLNNCLLLLDEEKHSEIVSSANLILADLFVQRDVFSGPYSSPEDSEDENEERSAPTDAASDDVFSCLTAKPSPSVSVKTLCTSSDVMEYGHSKASHFPALPTSMDERCTEALYHITKGLNSLDRDAKLHLRKHDTHEMAAHDPNIPIPLQYMTLVDASLKRDAKDISSTYRDNISVSKVDNVTSSGRESKLAPQPLVTDQIHSLNKDQNDHVVGNVLDIMAYSRQPNYTELTDALVAPNTWHTDCKQQLLIKAATVYKDLAQLAINGKNIGRARRCLKMGLHCYDAASILTPDQCNLRQNLCCSLMTAVGNVEMLFALSERSDASGLREQFMQENDQDVNIFQSAELELIQGRAYEWMYTFTFNKVLNLQNSLLAYQEAYKQESDERHSVASKLGGVLNQLGVYHMDEATNKLKGQGQPHGSVMESCRLSASYFARGITHFEKAEDVTSQAMLISNIARLMRLQAQSVALRDHEGSSEFSLEEKHYYTKAIQQYKTALDVLQHRDGAPSLWDTIYWDISSTYFTVATSLQDQPPLSILAHEQIEKDVIEMLGKCLQYCDVDTTSSRWDTCQYRASVAHHRMASMYHNRFRSEQAGSPNCKFLRLQASASYEEAVKCYRLVDCPCELLRVQLERVALAEFCLLGQTTAVSKMKTLRQALDLILENSDVLEGIEAQLMTCQNDPDFGARGFNEECHKLLNILLTRLQAITLQIVKLLSHKKCDANTATLSTYKGIYRLSLRDCESCDGNELKHAISVKKAVCGAKELYANLS